MHRQCFKHVCQLKAIFIILCLIHGLCVKQISQLRATLFLINRLCFKQISQLRFVLFYSCFVLKIVYSGIIHSVRSCHVNVVSSLLSLPLAFSVLLSVSICPTLSLIDFFFLCAFPSYISGVHHFWVRFLRM